MRNDVRGSYSLKKRILLVGAIVFVLLVIRLKDDPRIEETTSPASPLVSEPDSPLDWPMSVALKGEEWKIGAYDADGKRNVQDEIMNYRLRSKERTKKIQMALKDAGFYAGDIDGQMGPSTKRAIKAFQQSKGLQPDSIVGAKTWKELRKYSGD